MDDASAPPAEPVSPDIARLASAGEQEDAGAEPEQAGESEMARHRAHREEIDRLVATLPGPVRVQMEELFRARYTRIQKVDFESFMPDPNGNP